MKITACRITDYKRVRDVAITPEGDRSLILIGGKNRQGKSSIIDALTAAFGGAGAIVADPVRHGAERAEIRVELDHGALIVRRVIGADGKSTLEVRDELGPVKAPQAALAKLLGARFLDPLAFLALPAKEQRAQLMRQIPGAERIAELDEKRARAFARRTEVGRDADKAAAELARLDAARVAVAEPIDVAALAQEQRQAGELQRQGEAAGAAHRAAELAAKAAVDLVAKIEHELADARERAAAATAREQAARTALTAAADTWRAGAARRTEVEGALARANEHNAAVAAAQAQAARRAQVAAEVAKLQTERDSLSSVLRTIDDRKAAILAAAPLPVDGLAVTDEGIALAGVPFAQASAAERLRVALALAVAASPGLDDVWVRDGALLDDEMLAAAVTHAAAHGKRLWVEVVATGEPGTIVIRDGVVLEQTKGAA